MDLAPTIEHYSTGVVAFALFTIALVGALLSPERSTRRGFGAAVIAMLLFLGLTAAALILPVPEAMAGYLALIRQLLFAYGALRLFATLVFEIRAVRRLGRPTPKIVQQVLFGVILSLVTLAIVQTHLKVDLAGLLATSAVLSLVLGLALQDTLGNVFAGLSLQAEKHFSVGDWVTFDTFQGRVAQIGWRSTWIEDFNQDLVAVPNNVIARATLVNHSRPELVTAVRLVFGLPYTAPPNQVKEVLQQVLNDERRVMRDPAPWVRAHHFGESAIDYAVRFWIPSYEQRFEVIDALNTNVWYALQRAGLHVPFPTRTLHLHTHDEARTASLMEAQQRGIEALLASSEILSPLGPADLAALARQGRRLHFGAGELIFRRKEPGEACFVVLSGEVSVSLGRGRTLANVVRGQLFGEGAMLTGDPRTATTRAATDVELLEISRESFREVILANEAVAEQIATILERRRAERSGYDLDPTENAIPVQHSSRDSAARLVGRIREIFGLDR